MSTETLAIGDAEIPRMKTRIINLHREGVTDLAEIVRRTGTRPSYAAQVLSQAGLLRGYLDSFTGIEGEGNYYSRMFRDVLRYANEI